MKFRCGHDRLGQKIVRISLVLICAGVMSAQGIAETGNVAATVNVGVEGRAEYRLGMENGRLVKVRGVKADRRGEITVWVAGEQEEANVGVYEVRFVGQVAGDFDLSAYLQREDGGSIAGWPELWVSVWGELAEDHDGSLVELSGGRHTLSRSWYHMGMVGLGIVWTGVPIWWWVRRRQRGKEQSTIETECKPTLEDQMRELIELLMRGEADRETRAKLEMMMLMFWRERLGLVGIEHARAIGILREDECAGGLIRAIELWLHGSEGIRRPSEEEIVRLLEPYRGAAGVDEEEVVRAVAGEERRAGESVMGKEAGR